LNKFKEDLFDKKTIKRLTNGISLSDQQISAAKDWINLLDNDQLKGETNHYIIFADIILNKILGYPLDKIIHNENNVEYQYANSSGKKILCIEAKGTKTKSIFDRQDRTAAHRTPIHQTWDYMRTGDLEWGICTNYKQFGLLKRNEKTRKGYLFEFEDIKSNPEKLIEFIGIFSRENLVDGDQTMNIYNESITEEKEFTKEFYKLYHETRLMLIKAFKENENVSFNDAMYYTQIFLDRLIFIFFASDEKYVKERRLFSKRILKLLDGGLCNQHSKKIYDEISELFIAFDKGDDKLGIFGFNGGLFTPPFPPKIFFTDFKDSKFFEEELLNSKLSKSTELNEHDTAIILKYQNQLSPIIKNLLRLDSFDFTDEVNVIILGKIFEQSITDIESLNKDFSSRRKKDGVYYTHNETTEYICKNTIIPYLSKTNVTTIEELIDEYSDNIEELEKKFKEIKILDPACGSGAFLMQAVDILLDIGEAIQQIKESTGKYSSGNDTTIDKVTEEEAIRNIIENNIFGVDINRESIGITKLSLFLKLAAYERKLTSLTANIQVGNSLINDPTIGSSSFDWYERFPTIFEHPNLKKHIDKEHQDGFHIIIGNPPYVRGDTDDLKIIKEREWIKNSNQYVTLYERWDLFIPFIEKGLNLLHKDGVMSLIIKKSYNTAKYAEKSKKHIFDNHHFQQIDLFKNIKDLFDAAVENTIITVKKTKSKQKTKRILHIDSFENTIDLPATDNLKEMFAINPPMDLGKRLKNSELLGNICYISKGMVLNSDEKSAKGEFKKIDLLSNTSSKKHSKKYVEAEFLTRYRFKEFMYLEWNSERVPNKISRPTFPELYIHPKLIRGRTTDAVYDLDKIICSEECNVIVPYHQLKGVENRSIKSGITKWGGIQDREILEKNSAKIDLKFILCIMNSKFSKFYLNPMRKHSTEFYFYPNDLKNLPIMMINLEKQKPFVEKTQKRIELARDYGETLESFSRHLKRNYPLKDFVKKFEKIYEITFDEFWKEIKKQKIKVGPTEEQTEDRHFTKTNNQLRLIVEEIKSIDQELDEMVFALYEISDSEKMMIESNVNDSNI